MERIVNYQNYAIWSTLNICFNSFLPVCPFLPVRDVYVPRCLLSSFDQISTKYGLILDYFMNEMVILWKFMKFWPHDQKLCKNYNFHEFRDINVPKSWFFTIFHDFERIFGFLHVRYLPTWKKSNLWLNFDHLVKNLRKIWNFWHFGT